MTKCQVCNKEDSIMKIGATIETGQTCFNKLSDKKVKLRPDVTLKFLQEAIGLG